MTYINCELPEIDILIERLKDEVWSSYYSKFDSFKGSMESIKYMLEFLKKA